jgi:hypothetical protein
MSSRLSSRDLAELVELGTAHAFADFLAALPPEAGAHSVPLAGGIVLVCPPGPALFNEAAGLGTRQPVTESVLDEALGLFRAAGSQQFEVLVSPVAEPQADLLRWLENRGMSMRGRTAKMYRGGNRRASVETDLRVERIGPRHAEEFARVILDVFGFPESLRPAFKACTDREGWHCYAAFDGDELVATGKLYVRDRLGWLGAGATLPSRRRRGAQGAIMAARVNAAIDQGCEWIIVETGEDRPEAPNPSYHNMLRTGFELAYHRPTYSPTKAP